MNENPQKQKRQVRFHGIGQQLNKNMQLHVLHCVLQIFFSRPGSNFPLWNYEFLKESGPHLWNTNFNRLGEASMAFGWMHLVKSFHGKMHQSLILGLAREELQFFEHFAPKNTGFPVGCTPNKKSHMWERSHIGENSWVSGGSGFWWWTIW